MKINPVLYESLKATALGRAKLKLLFSISQKDGILPTKKAGLDFIDSIPEEQFTVAEFFTALLTLRSCKMVTLKSRSNFANLNSALRKLDQFPVQEPVFYQFKSKFNDTDLCAFIKGDKLRDFEGHLYTIYIFDEESMPDSFRSVVEVRSSQTDPEPAFRVNHNNEFEGYKKTDPVIFENPVLSICVDLLIELANNHLNTVIPMSQVSQPDFKSKHAYEFEPPKDKTLLNLLRLVRQRKAQCFVADVPLEQIVPYSYEHCFKIPLYIIDHAHEVIGDDVFPMLVYQQGERFIMSDCYPAYLAIRRMRRQIARVVIIGTEPPRNISIINQGGDELIPPVMAISGRGYDQLDKNMKDALLDKYLKKLNVLQSTNDIVNAQCIVLTEDSETDMLTCLLQASEFNVDETLVLSYKNCTNLDSLDISVRMIKNVNPYTTVLIHRDRDYMVDSEVAKIVSRIEAADAVAFVTEGTDIESYFINANHIAELYGAIPISTIDTLIEKATQETSSSSIELIKKHEHGDKYKAKASYLDDFILDIYESRKARFRHGKKTLRILKSFLQKEVGSNIDLVRPTLSLKDPKLNRVASAIWKFA